jgi:P4 family phage/plasmid primase-like protien
LISANLTEVRSWLDIVYGDMPGYLNICSTSNWQGRCFTAAQIDEAVAYVDTLDKAGTQGIYARVTSLRELPDAELKSRGTEAQSLNLPGLWADLDICGPGHKTDKPLPATVEDAMRIIEVSGLPEPTVWIHSGGGLYPWWLLSSSTEITDLESTKILSSNWQTIIEHASKQLGYSYGTGVKDLARVLRIPGTVNRKIADDPHPCQVMYEHSGGRQYTIYELTEAMLAAMPEVPAPAPRRDLSSLLASGSSTSDRPGDDFNARADWRDLLSDWEWVRQTGGTWYLRRPGKNEGISATLGHSQDGVDRLYVFSDATVFEQNRPYDKYGAYVLLQHGGNFREATKALSTAGYGKPLSAPLSVEYPQSVVQATPAVDERPEAMLRDADIDVSPEPEAVKPAPRMTDWTHVGAGRFAVKINKDQFHEIYEEKGNRACDAGWRVYADGAWSEDLTKRLARAMESVSDMIQRQAESQLVKAEASFAHEGTDENKKRLKLAEKNLTFARGCASDAGIKAITNRYSVQEGVARSIKEFDTRQELLCLHNGTFNLNTMTLQDHSPADLLTRRMPLAYDPEAECPLWTQAMEGWIPDTETRDYVQRALGYTLLGTVEEGVFFVPWGETGCGKSQFVETLTALFGDFGSTAEASTFRDKTFTGNDSTNNIHDLRGKRFVASSETTRGAALNEELVKRATGEDALTTRALYQNNMTWKPQFVLWMATNFKPNLSSEDSAIWRRVKPIHFPNSFYDSADRIKGLGSRLVAEELAGMFNWLLEGVRKYRESGLGEPASMTEAIQDYRDEQDPVTQFLVEGEAGGKIQIIDGAECESSKIYNVYANYCIENNLKPITPTRFGRILSDKKFGTRRGTNGVKMRQGISIVWLAAAAPTSWPRKS